MERIDPSKHHALLVSLEWQQLKLGWLVVFSMVSIEDVVFSKGR
jgi:hypothetical protein